MYFAFWADRWLGGTSGWTAEEKGCYISLLVHQFVHGSIPAEVRRLARIAGCPTEQAFEAIWEAVLQDKFERVEGGYANPRMAEERQRSVEHLQQRSEAGRRSAARRRNPTSVATTVATSVATTDGTTQTQTQTHTSNNRRGLLLESMTSNVRVLKAALRWQAYRQEAAIKAWTATTWRKRLAEAEQDPAAFEAAVDWSISQGYQGLFAPSKHDVRDDDGMPKALKVLKEWHDEEEVPYENQ
jgi:uncharacterized protein YdaU (DUF1376 family)